MPLVAVAAPEAMNSPKTVRVEMLRNVRTRIGTLAAGTIFTVQLLERGTNWIKVQLPFGARKTLFNFEATWR